MKLTILPDGRVAVEVRMTKQLASSLTELAFENGQSISDFILDLTLEALRSRRGTQ